jgi:hypothetical protein
LSSEFKFGLFTTHLPQRFAHKDIIQMTPHEFHEIVRDWHVAKTENVIYAMTSCFWTLLLNYELNEMMGTILIIQLIHVTPEMEAERDTESTELSDFNVRLAKYLT